MLRLWKKLQLTVVGIIVLQVTHTCHEYSRVTANVPWLDACGWLLRPTIRLYHAIAASNSDQINNLDSNAVFFHDTSLAWNPCIYIPVIRPGIRSSLVHSSRMWFCEMMPVHTSVCLTAFVNASNFSTGLYSLFNESPSYTILCWWPWLG